jgi:hypothetical protein
MIKFMSAQLESDIPASSQARRIKLDIEKDFVAMSKTPCRAGSDPNWSIVHRHSKNTLRNKSALDMTHGIARAVASKAPRLSYCFM